MYMYMVYIYYIYMCIVYMYNCIYTGSRKWSNLGQLKKTFQDFFIVKNP